jgi:hypothetical protein
MILERSYLKSQIIWFLRLPLFSFKESFFVCFTILTYPFLFIGHKYVSIKPKTLIEIIKSKPRKPLHLQ